MTVSVAGFRFLIWYWKILYSPPSLEHFEAHLQGRNISLLEMKSARTWRWPCTLISPRRSWYVYIYIYRERERERERDRQTDRQTERELLYEWRFTANQFNLASPLRLTTSNFIFQLNTCGYSPYVTSSLTRVWVCRLQLVLVLAGAVILRSESRGTHDHILLSQIRDSLNPEGQVPVFISPRNKMAQLYPQVLASLFVATKTRWTRWWLTAVMIQCVVKRTYVHFLSSWTLPAAIDPALSPPQTLVLWTTMYLRKVSPTGEERIAVAHVYVVQQSLYYYVLRD
jgi:general stress protein CsbA